MEDGICDSEGHLALAGPSMAHSLRMQELQPMEASHQHQAPIAKTEPERLQIQKQWLELEPLNQQVEKEERKAVRHLRVLMAEVGGGFEFLSSRGALKGSPQGIRRDYAMAVLLGKLALLHSRSNSLSDLNDLKELIALDNLAQELVSKHFAGRDPLQVARSKWEEIEAWVQAVGQMKQQCSIVPQAFSLQLPSLSELAEIRRKLEGDVASLAQRLKAQVDCLPKDAAIDGVVLSELSELAEIDDFREGKKGNRSAVFAQTWQEVAVVKHSLEPVTGLVNDLQPRMVQRMESALASLQQWQDLLTEHEQVLQSLVSDLEAGHLSEAAFSRRKLGRVRFAGLNYQAITKLQSLKSALLDLEGAKRWKAAELAKQLRDKHPKAEAQSELIQQLNKYLVRSVRNKRQALILALLMLGFISAGGKILIDGHLEKQRLSAEAKAKSEVDLLDFDRLNTETKVRFSRKVESGIVGDKFNVLLSSSVSLQLCFIPPGRFTMGSPFSEDGRASDEEQVEVIISQPFWFAKTEVTQAQWVAVMGSNPSHFKGAQLPVENLYWYAAQSFINKLNEIKILPDGWKFALPTAAQWEYACRATEKGPYSGGSLEELAWYDGNSEWKTHEVGQKKPNAWGLHDMHGNASEWCADWYSDTLQGGVDPRGPETGDKRVALGGSWFSIASRCRAASRRSAPQGCHESYLGFRPALVLSN